MPEPTNHAWRKSTFSGTGGCVDVWIQPDVIQVRDSKDPAGGTLTFTPDEWAAFIQGVRNGEFDNA